MIIKLLKIIDFGKFHNKIIELDKGINLIYGPNESGKSTAFNFIDSVLYGFSKDSTKRRLYDEQKDKLRPWNNNQYQGVMEIEDIDDYYIKRDFEKDIIKFINTSEGTDLSEEEILFKYSRVKQPGAYFFDVNRNIFKSTLFIGQLQSKITQDNYHSLKELIQNSILSKDKSINTNRAIEKLIKRINEIGTENRKNTYIGSIKKEIDNITKKILLLEEKNNYYKDDIKRITELKNKLNILEKNNEKLKKIKEQKIYNEVVNNLKEIEELKKINNTEYFYDYNRLLRLLEEKKLYEDRISDFNFQLIELKEDNINKGLNEDIDIFQKNKILYIKMKKILFSSVSIISLLILAVSVMSGKHLIIVLIPVILLFFYLILRRIENNNIRSLMEKYDKSSFYKLEEYFRLEKENTIKNNLKNEVIRDNRQKIKENINLCIDRINVLKKEINDLCIKYNVNSTENIKNFLERKIKSSNEEKINSLININKILLSGKTLESYNHNIIIENIEDKSLEKDIEEIKLEIASCEERENIYSDNMIELSNLNEQLTIKKRIFESYIIERDNTIKALEIIQNILKTNRKSLMPEIRLQMSQIIKKITDNKYTEITISDNFDIKLYDEKSHGFVELETLSNGTVDEVYLAFRLSMINLFNKNAPIILDDHFIQYDDYRLRNVLKVLDEIKENHQIIIFTATNREKDILDKDKIMYRYIDLRE